MPEIDLFKVDRLSDIIGNSFAIDALKRFAVSTNGNVHEKPLMIYGPSGVGKTASVMALANEYNWNVIELNAGDYRDGETIKKMLMPAANSRNIFGKRNLILMDEIDELAARFDNGASTAILELIKNSKNPIIFVANNFWNKKITFLRYAVNAVEFKRIDSKLIMLHLDRITKKWKLNIDKKILEMISVRAGGDCRSAINDLYIVMDSGKYNEEILNYVGLRDRKADIFSVLDKVFFANTLVAPLIALANSDLDNGMLIGWLDENISIRYKDAKELSTAYNNLSGATIFSSRAARSQYYGFWRYMNVLMGSGVSLAKLNYPSTVERYKFPKIINEMSKSKTDREKTKLVVEKLKKKIHANIKHITTNYLPLFKEMATNALKETDTDTVYEFFEKTYGLEKKEVELIINA
ncbi:replication factor C large subunit [Candidatus Marsarchaeota archaeon]|jgi:replication factor C large subunit|nr:replication factor C large subunit [Candidatus Marsarchaeota archaeon]MCL5089705.1 replication factor C large subunit [Candidatus Marsarchaeota archaeon]